MSMQGSRDIDRGQSIERTEPMTESPTASSQQLFNLTAPLLAAGREDHLRASCDGLTITVKVNYTDNVDDKFSFESSFTRYADYSTSVNLSAVEDDLIKDISEQLTQDILNKSVNAW